MPLSVIRCCPDSCAPTLRLPCKVRRTGRGPGVSFVHDRLVDVSCSRARPGSRERGVGVPWYSRARRCPVRESRTRGSGIPICRVVPRGESGPGPRRPGTRGAQRPGSCIGARPTRARTAAAACCKRLLVVSAQGTTQPKSETWSIGRSRRQFADRKIAARKLKGRSRQIFAMVGRSS